MIVSWFFRRYGCKLIITQVLLGILLYQTSIAQPAYHFQKLTNRQGLSHNTVNDIVQDSSGVMWIASKQGLNKYDSYHFTSYFREEYPEISSNIINALCISTDHILYLGTAGGLAKYEASGESFTRLTMDGVSLPFVNDLLETSDRTLLIGTNEGLYRYFPDENKIIKQLSLRNSEITSMVETDKGTYLVGTFTGLYEVDNDGIIQERYFTGNTEGMPSNLIQVLYRNGEGTVWVGTIDAGLSIFDPGEGLFDPVALTTEHLEGSEFIRTIREDRAGKLWVGTELGLFICDRRGKTVVHIQQTLEDSEDFLNDNAIYSLYLSRENIMWIGTYFGGVNYTALSSHRGFNHLYPGNDQNELRGKAVNRLFKDSRGLIWITTEDGGVCTFDPESSTILDYYHFDPVNGLSSNNIHSVCEDRNGNIWFGHFRTGIDIYDPTRNRFTHLLPNPDHADQFPYNSVYTLYVDSREQLWVCTRMNIKIYDYKDQQLIPFKPDQIAGIFTYDMVEDPEGKIWISTRSNGIISYDPVKDTLRSFVNGTSSARGLSSNQIIASMVDSRGMVWFGTMEGGVNIYHPEKDSFEVISSVHGLPNNTVYGILEDDQQFIWLSSNSGITRYDPGTGDMKNYSLEDGLSQMQFNYGSYFKDEEDGTLYFGSIGGLTYFHPEHIRENQVPPSVIFTDFKLFNNSVRIGEKSLLSRHINYTDQLQLTYSQNVFSVDFMAINYTSPGNNRYYYYLEGFESDWNDAGNRTSVTYTNLSPGAYTFHVKAKNNDGLESPVARSLQIRVSRPWWLSTLALIIYGILAVTVVLVSRRAIIIREKEKSALSIEKMEKEKMRQLNQQRINFFTFISHEFKSPLSVVIASIEELSKTISFNEEISKHFDRVRKSAKRLSFLIGQLMDFRKIETKHAQLALQKGDVIQFLRDMCMAFAPIFTRQRIRFHFSCNRDSFVCWFDADKLEKIVTNLISNAIKYTPVDGTITCTADILEHAEQENGSAKLEISISDTGKGMDAKELEWAFDPFHMDSERKARHSGTGIGLTLVKSLVEYLGGEIQASSEPGKGTSFTVTLPTDLSRASNITLDGRGIQGDREIDLDHISYQADILQPVEKDEHDHGHYYIMIVEDKLELAEVLIGHFSKHYRVSYAKNGLEAMKLVKQEEPDLIITDIVMPGMSGLELCKKIKSAEDTSHIAVILLTGKVSPEDRMEGLKAGAEAYISKPFDFSELDLHVKHFLEIRDKLRKKLILENTLDLNDINIHNRDKVFIENVTRIIKENIGNESFSVEDMAGQLGMSRTLVYLKHKKLLNMSAKEYLQLLRFQKAIELMKATDENISQIAYTVGFSDPNYFSRAFKKIYKVSPTEYKENLPKTSGEEFSKDFS